ncbi:uncharacterized protein LOC126184371 [Schistocerca cancellata]|uniref:uncharacterized protein LOC126184371 n=1 Tax=Schistocerca cancellata TaxID=274614 RepID=UPI002117BB99|nr:uncharacterized protein LOC126184371 [Schistocerca cancellata]
MPQCQDTADWAHMLEVTGTLEFPLLTSTLLECVVGYLGIELPSSVPNILTESSLWLPAISENCFRFNTTKLKNPNILNQYIRELETHKPEVESKINNDDTNQAWNALKENITRATTSVLGHFTTTKNPWFDAECSNAIEDRKLAREKFLQKPITQNKLIFEEKQKHARKLIRKKKRDFMNHKLKRAENDRTTDSRGFFKSINMFKSGNIKNYGQFITDPDGSLLTERSDIANRWKEYFNELLNAPTISVSQEDDNEYLTADPSDEEPSLAEIKESIKKLKRHKAPGSDGIDTDIWKLKPGAEQRAGLYQALAFSGR